MPCGKKKKGKKGKLSFKLEINKGKISLFVKDVFPKSKWVNMTEEFYVRRGGNENLTIEEVAAGLIRLGEEVLYG